MIKNQDQKLRSEIMAYLRDTLTRNPTMTSGEFADKVIKAVPRHDKETGFNYHSMRLRHIAEILECNDPLHVSEAKTLRELADMLDDKCRG